MDINGPINRSPDYYAITKLLIFSLRWEIISTRDYNVSIENYYNKIYIICNLSMIQNPKKRDLNVTKKLFKFQIL